MKKKKTSTKEAMLNKDFRQAINFAFNRHSYAAQLNGEDGADKIIRNSLVPDNFVQSGGKTLVISLKQNWSTMETNGKALSL